MRTDAKRPVVLIISSFYLPGTRSGGGTRTIVNTVDRLSDRFDFRIITRGYDAGPDKMPYENVRLGEWNEVGKAQVFYLRKVPEIRKVLPEAVRELSPSVLYANSFFSPMTIASLWLRKRGKTGSMPFIIAPCGELSEGARRQKRFKKEIFLRTAVSAGLYSGLIWKASSELEKSEIERIGAPRGSILISPDLVPSQIFAGFDIAKKPLKVPGKLRLVFVSRVDRKKNLKWLLDNVSLPEGTVSLDVYGTVEHEGYLEKLLDAAKNGSSGIEMRFKGPLEHSEVAETFFKYHFKVLPTLGENFGHVFLEALSAGCPLIISDRTPWTDLEERNAGWSLPLEDPASWQDVLTRCIEMGEEEYKNLSVSARAYADAVLGDPGIEEQTEALIRNAIEAGGRAAEVGGLG